LNSSASETYIDVIVPGTKRLGVFNLFFLSSNFVDTFIGIWRLLIYLYTNTLPFAAADGALLEDLMAADRYDLPDMRVLCESMLLPSPSNWIEVSIIVFDYCLVQ
jgi:hypothetical protein